MPKNLDPVGHFGAPWRPFGFCRRCGVAGGERVPPSPLGWYFIYNSSFTGSPLWNLFSRKSKMLKNTWNTSFGIMFGLSFLTLRHFVEPISGKIQLKKLLMNRFLSFLNQIARSQKGLPKKLLRHVRKDTRSKTGSNLRRMML